MILGIRVRPVASELSDIDRVDADRVVSRIDNSWQAEIRPIYKKK